MFSRNTSVHCLPSRNFFFLSFYPFCASTTMRIPLLCTLFSTALSAVLERQQQVMGSNACGLPGITQFDCSYDSPKYRCVGGGGKSCATIASNQLISRRSSMLLPLDFFGTDSSAWQYRYCICYEAVRYWGDTSWGPGCEACRNSVSSRRSGSKSRSHGIKEVGAITDGTCSGNNANGHPYESTPGPWIYGPGQHGGGGTQQPNNQPTDASGCAITYVSEGRVRAGLTRSTMASAWIGLAWYLHR